MKHLKQILAGGIAVLSLTTSALAAPLYATPAEAAAGVTGKTLEEVQAERWSGKSYGTIAAEAGALEEFQAAVWEMQAQTLAAWAAEGLPTQAQADARLEALQQRQAACGGLGSGFCSPGSGMGGGFGGGMGPGCGRGLRSGHCRNLCT